jgi:hypothetical protein
MGSPSKSASTKRQKPARPRYHHERWLGLPELKRIFGTSDLKSVMASWYFPKPIVGGDSPRWRADDIKVFRELYKGRTLTPARAGTVMAARFFAPDGKVNLHAVASEFGITKAALAQSLGLAEETLQRSSRASARKTQQRLREMLDILTRVEPWAGGMPQALGWYRGQGIPALGDQTAEALVKTDQAGLVRAYLDGVAAGGYA